MESGVTTITHNGVVRCRLGNLAASEPEPGTADQPAKPFVVVDGTTYLNEAFIKDGTLDCKVASNWSVKMQVTQDGKYVAAGIGLGFPSQFLVSADRFAIKESSEFEQALDRRLASIDHRLANLESNRFRRPHAN